MTNKIRGEAELLAGGESYRLLLTLGALAEIEWIGSHQSL